MIEQVLLDMDGIITNFVKGICNAHNRPDPYNGDEHLGEFDMAKIWKMSNREFWKPCDYSFWRTLDWMPDGKQIVALVESLIDESKIRVLTAPSSNDGCYDGKKDWLRFNLPGYKMIAGSDKEFCSAPHRLLIDDRDENVKKYIESGGIAFLVPRPWNSAHDRQENWMLQLEKLFLGGNL